MRKAIFDFLYLIGATHLLFRINKLRNKIPIILFHRVSPVPDPCWPPLTPDQFEKTIQLLSKHYKFYSLDQILNKTSSISKNACCVVFDDGFIDFKLFALPVLLKYNIPTTLFLPTSNIDNNHPIWTSKIDNIILNTDKSKDDTKITIGKEKIILKLQSDKDLFNTATAIKNILINLNIETRNTIIKNLKELLPDENITDLEMLSWTDINIIKNSKPTLISIQSHTHTHPYLPTLNKNEIQSELEISQSILRDKSFNNIDKLAYPMGGYDAKTIEATKQLYAYAFKVGNRLIDLKKIKNEIDYKYQIPRINIHTSNPKETFIFINGFHSFFKSILFR